MFDKRWKSAISLDRNTSAPLESKSVSPCLAAACTCEGVAVAGDMLSFLNIVLKIKSTIQIQHEVERINKHNSDLQMRCQKVEASAREIEKQGKRP